MLSQGLVDEGLVACLCLKSGEATGIGSTGLFSLRR